MTEEKPYRGVRMKNGMEFRWCSACQTEHRATAFYDYRKYGGVLHSMCRAKEQESQRKWHKLKDVKDVDVHVQRIRRMKKDRRFQSALYAWKRGVLNDRELRLVLSQVDF